MAGYDGAFEVTKEQTPFSFFLPPNSPHRRRRHRFFSPSIINSIKNQFSSQEEPSSTTTRTTSGTTMAAPLSLAPRAASSPSRPRGASSSRCCRSSVAAALAREMASRLSGESFCFWESFCAFFLRGDCSVRVFRRDREARTTKKSVPRSAPEETKSPLYRQDACRIGNSVS